MRRIIVVPAVFIGCLIVIWVGTVAASKMPSQALLAPTQTAISAANLEASQTAQTEAVEHHNNCTLSTQYPAEIHQWCSLIETAAQETGFTGQPDRSRDAAGKAAALLMSSLAAAPWG